MTPTLDNFETNSKFFFFPLFLSLYMPVAAGIEPSNTGKYVACFTTELPPLATVTNY